MRTSMRRVRSAAMAAGLAAGLWMTAGASAQEVRLEGAGARREALNEMQLKPTPAGLWGSLSQWSGGGGAATAESTAGKVVLVVTWASYYKPSHSALTLAQGLSAKHADKGLVVVGVHNPRGFEGAAKVAADLGVKFALAADADGKFREALKVDNDPDFYLIDRAGNVRYADVDTASVDRAVQELLGETTEKAAALPAEVAAGRAARDLEARRTVELGGVVRPGERPSVEFELPDSEAYKAAKWPKLRRSEKGDNFDQIVEKIERDHPALTLPEDGWIPARPDFKGKIIVVYMFDPKLRFMLNVFPTMNRVQTVYERDAVVIGNATESNQANNNATPEEQASRNERNAKIIESIRSNVALNHSIIPGMIGTQTLGSLPIMGSSIDEAALVLVCSSDGVIRWLGHPRDDRFTLAMTTMMREDPGVKARRAAEDAAAAHK